MRTSRSSRALAVTVLLSALSGGTWAPFGSTPKVSFGSLNYTDADTSWQENSNNIAQATATPFAALILTRRGGLQASVLISSVFLVAQCGLFAVAAAFPAAAALEHINALPLAASVAGGISAAFIQGVPTMISASFFLPSQRGRTTASMYVATYFGVCVSYIGYSAVEKSVSFVGLKYLLYAEAAAALLLLMATFWIFPSPPSRVVGQPLLNGSGGGGGNKDEPPGGSGASNPAGDSKDGDQAAPSRLGFVEGLVHCCKQPSVVLLVIVAAGINGTLNAWQGVIPILFRDLGNATAGGGSNATGGGGSGFKSSRGDVCSLVSSLGYAIGGYLGGELGDRCFAQKLKALLMICIGIGTVTFLFITMAIPPTFFPSGMHLHLHRQSQVYPMILSFSFTSGACLGGTMPIALELLAETAYPAAEGITANAALFFTQLFCFALTALVPVWSGATVTFSVFAVAAASLVLTMLARPRYNRRKAQIAKAAATTFG